MKGSNNIDLFEREGVIREELLTRLAEALGIDLATVEGLMDQDRNAYLAEREVWVNEAMLMVLVRVGPSEPITAASLVRHSETHSTGVPCC
jgi:hypothetical protein